MVGGELLLGFGQCRDVGRWPDHCCSVAGWRTTVIFFVHVRRPAAHAKTFSSPRLVSVKRRPITDRAESRAV